jgi:hypothetical protein
VNRPDEHVARMSRSEVILWLNVTLGAGSLSLVIATEGWSSQVSLVLAFAWAVMCLLHDGLGGKRPAANREIAFAVIICLSSLLPGMLMYVSVLAYSAYVLFIHDRSPVARRAALLLFAIAGNQLIAPLLILLFGTELNGLDAFLVEKTYASGISRDGTVLFRDNGHAIEVFSQCSSFNNISLGLLFWAAVTAGGGRSFTKADALVGLLVAIALLAVNVARLHLLALDHDRYAYWHYEYGNRIYSYVFGMTMIAPPLLRLWFSRAQCLHSSARPVGATPGTARWLPCEVRARARNRASPPRAGSREDS